MLARPENKRAVGKIDARFPGCTGSAAAFTLVELLTAIGILAILVALLFTAFDTSSKVTVRQENKTEVNQVVRAVLEQISRDLERTVYLNNVVNMYQTDSGSYIASLIPTNTLYLLGDLPPPEWNPLGSYVNVGYRITQTNMDTGIPGVTNKWVLVRGDDPYVNTAAYTNNWWDHLESSPYWKILSDNIIGIQFLFYTNNINVHTNSSFDTTMYATNWNATTIPNPLPYSVGVWIHAVDTDNYNRALKIDPDLTGEGTNIIQRNVRSFFTRNYI